MLQFREKWFKPLFPHFRLSLKKTRTEDHQTKWDEYLTLHIFNLIFWPDFSVDSGPKRSRGSETQMGTHTCVFCAGIFLYTLWAFIFSLRAPDYSLRCISHDVDKLFHLSLPQAPHLWDGNVNSIYLTGSSRGLTELIFRKFLKQWCIIRVK